MCVVCEQESDFLRFASFSNTTRALNDIHLHIVDCVSHTIFALYTSVDNNNNTNDNNLNDGDDDEKEKKVHGFAFVFERKQCQCFQPKTHTHEMKRME